MKREKFKSFWDAWSKAWIASSIHWKGEEVALSSLCDLRSAYGDALYDRYCFIKKTVKDSYFQDSTKRLSRYKRAAIIAYTVNGATPLKYLEKNIQDDMHPAFLKQRLAFYVAIGSIIQDFSEDEVNALPKPYFDFDNLGKCDIVDDEDTFLLSVYKDLFFAEVYENYNVLTMANVFGLLTERASNLSRLAPVEDAQGTG